MKKLVFAILFILVIDYVCYYLFIFGTKDNISKLIKNIKSIINVENEVQIPEHLTQEFWKNVTPEQLKEKLKNMEDVNEVREDNKRNMLHLLALYGKHPEMIDILVEAGVNCQLKDSEYGYSLKAINYTVARKKQAFEFTKKLLKCDTDVNEMGTVSASWGEFMVTPLTSAVFYRAPVEVIKLLLEKGANPNLPEQPSPSPLISASVPNRNIQISFIDPEIVQLLLNYKADITRKDSRGKTAYDYMKNNSEFVKTKLFKKLSVRFQ